MAQASLAHGVGFFIPADEEPTINKKKIVGFCQLLIDRGLPDKVKWGIDTRVTAICRDRDLPKFYRKAGLVHSRLAEAGRIAADAGHRSWACIPDRRILRPCRLHDSAARWRLNPACLRFFYVNSP